MTDMYSAASDRDHNRSWQEPDEDPENELKPEDFYPPVDHMRPPPPSEWTAIPVLQPVTARVQMPNPEIWGEEKEDSDEAPF